MLDCTRAMLEQELGRRLMQNMGQPPFRLADTVEGKCAAALERIRLILDDVHLGRKNDDFECVECIIQVLEELGIRTERHKFGLESAQGAPLAQRRGR